jgi:hypothetical protein
VGAFLFLRFYGKMKKLALLFAFSKWKYVGKVKIVENFPKVPKSP